MRTARAETSVLDRLNSRQVPVLPKGAPYLLNSVTDENISFIELAQIVERFPTIAGQLIALANSAWSSPVNTISSLVMACSRLGFDVVRSTSIALAVSAPFNPSRCPGFNAEDFWTSALMTADAASRLAPEVSSLGGLEPSTARTAGLLHNLGLLWLADGLPDEVNQAISLTKQHPPKSLGQALSELIGIDDAQAGGYLGSVWNLPQQFVMAMAHCFEPNFRGSHWETANLVGMAVCLVSAVRQDAPCPVLDIRLQRLGIGTSAAEKVFLQLQRQFEKIQDLAETLFRH